MCYFVSRGYAFGTPLALAFLPVNNNVCCYLKSCKSLPHMSMGNSIAWPCGPMDKASAYRAGVADSRLAGVNLLKGVVLLDSNYFRES